MKTPAAHQADLPRIDVLRVLFPEFEISELLGRGGMGAVYRAHHTRLDRPVALKILLPDLAKDVEFAARFTREARAMARLNHPNVVGIHDFGERGDLFFLVMEFVDGPNLRQLIESGHLSTQDALGIVPQICDALQFAHDRGVVHRDIKPENILIDEDLRVRISDFGLAKVVETDGLPMLTRTEQVFGTPHYMAPEQMRGTGAVDYRADIYSLGVVLYEMLTGELPIGRFEPPSSKKGVHPGMDRVVMKSLASEPARRYQSASELKAAVGAPGAAAQTPRRPASKEEGVGMITRFDRWLGPGGTLKKQDVPWFALIAGLVVTFALFFPWYKGPVKYGEIYSAYGFPRGQSTVKGWELFLYDIGMFMNVIYAAVFCLGTVMIRHGFRISTRALAIIAGLGVAQCGALVGIEIARDLETQVAPIIAGSAFLVMIYLVTAKAE